MVGGPEYIVGVDGGGTGCRVRLADADGHGISLARGGPANLNTDFDAALENITQAVSLAYDKAGLNPKRRKHDVAWLGLAGAGVGDLAERMERAVGFARTRVSTDCNTTVEGALGGSDGTVALVGTGSFFVRRSKGRDRRIGGWGYQLGDECGGAWLGRELLRAVLNAHDGLVDHSELTLSVLARFGGTPGDVVDFAHRASPGEIAGLAPDIAAAYESGDPIAAEILGRAIQVLCDRLDALGAQEGGALYLVGGLAAVFSPLLPDRYRRICRQPAGDALDGALALAARCLAHSKEGTA